MLEKLLGRLPVSAKENKPLKWSYRLLSKLFNFKPHRYYILGRDSHRIRQLKDIHKGQRCFIIGTGPSLNNTNLKLLEGETVFGVNTLYRGLADFDIRCNYYAVSDPAIWKAHFAGISALDTTLFLSDDAVKEYLSNRKRYRKYLQKEPLLIRGLGPVWTKGWEVRDLSRGAYFGYTVIMDICLQAAYYMGFEKVYLLGCDCDYSGAHRFDGLETEAKGGGAIGAWDDVFTSYRIARQVYEEDGREIINATVGGKLEIFERQKLEEIVRSSQGT